MKVMTVLGTRPEIIRLSRVIPALDRYAHHILVHTGQNYDDKLNGIFFEQLEVRPPNHVLNGRAGSFGEQVAGIMSGIDGLIQTHQPDRFLVLGDTNSGLSAIVARRYGIPVYHMEAGNRCYDFRVPEESNRRIIDHISTVLLPYTERSRDNLLREGIAADRVYVTGNPIGEVLDYYSPQIRTSPILDQLSLTEGKYFVVTLHRAENVDSEVRLCNCLLACSQLHAEYGFPVVCSVHPRTRARARQFNLPLDESGVQYLDPLGLFDFVKLEQSAFCVLTDSGTVQEEACIFRVPNVTLRDVTERPETIECGSNVLAGCDPDCILRLVKFVTDRPCAWNAPQEYLIDRVADSVTKIVMARHTST